MADAYFAINPNDRPKHPAPGQAAPQGRPATGNIPPDGNAGSNAYSTEDDSAGKKRKPNPRPESQDQGWLTDFLGVNEQEINAADATGLNVSTPSTEQPPQPFVERRQRVTIAPDGTKVTNDRGRE